MNISKTSRRVLALIAAAMACVAMGVSAQADTARTTDGAVVKTDAGVVRGTVAADLR
ncbi:hypothetical protein ABZU32_06165 [Sphaerisporangium sp. NPDC005288]|uniref:hypothetical protein n=1 Tax=Sphaerisporangium sp. NPDC005288 TaxID=3155114 RepID=UPI0033ABE0E3